jgi:hypothetical protein
MWKDAFKDKGVELALVILSLIAILVAFFPGATGNINAYLPDRIFIFLYKLFLDFLPFLITILLGYWAFKMWLHYIRQDFISGIEWIVLEVVPPREVLRSPAAMELFLTNGLYHWSNKGGREEFWQGAVWFWFSLEIVSLEGQVHFYIRIPSRLRSLVETQMYAQYPQAQVKLAEDYSLAVDHFGSHSEWKGWGCEWKLAKPEAYPIKTYKDFGLDKDPDEELKIDPISPVIEFFGSLQKGEQAWTQIVITPSKKTWKTKGTWFGKHDWVKEALNVQMDLLKPYTRYHENKVMGGYSLEIRKPDFLDKVTEAMTEKTEKLGFETGIRTMYIAKKESWNMNNRRNIRLMFRQYSKPDCNEILRFNATQGDALGSGILGLSPEQVDVLANRMLHEYRERAFYHLPMRHHLFSEHAFHSMMPIPGLQQLFSFIVKQFFLPYFHHETYVLNVEEIATLWHFPGQILKVPTLERIESKEASPPPNLPV